jgi:hypothetical protein
VTIGGRQAQLSYCDEPETWVQCECCSKWRTLAKEGNQQWAGRFTCDMNTWDTEVNMCDAPEEAEKEAAAPGGAAPGGAPAPPPPAGVQTEREAKANLASVEMASQHYNQGNACSKTDDHGPSWCMRTVVVGYRVHRQWLCRVHIGCDYASCASSTIVKARCNLGNMLLRHGHHDEAIAQFTAAVARGTEDTR